MTPEQWRQVRDLYHLAVVGSASERDTLLAAADEEVGREVRSLLARETDAESFLESPAMELVGRALAAEYINVEGQVFGPYQLRSLLGFGGMGEVYRAWDPKLGREVAIKRLPPSLAADNAARSRLNREAHALAALSHPHIGAIYGLVEEGGVLGLVLELIDGPSLADTISTLRLPQILRIASELVDALDAAHEKGIVHRDLKPANIKLAPGVGVKVLDFGLAKIFTEAAEGDRPRSPTPADTHTGATLGTPAYMSPEQARGQLVDKRTDIWAFGCVLFEMIAGRRPFDAATASDTLVKVLEHEPDWARIPAGTPTGISRLIRRCLEKDPRVRLRDISDARIDLTDATATRTDPHVSPRRIWTRRLLWSSPIAATVALFLWLLGGMRWPRPAIETPIEFSVALPDGAVPSSAAVSPDGRSIAIDAFSGSQQIWLRRLDASEAMVIPGTNNGWRPFWSPDGSKLGFFASGKLKIVGIDPPAPPIVLCDAPQDLGGTWNNDNIILFSADQRLLTVPASGGTSQALDLQTADEEGGSQAFPRFLSDQRHFVYHTTGARGGMERIGSLDSSATTHLIDTSHPAAYSAPYLLFVRGTTLMSQVLDDRSLALRGVPAIMVRDVVPRYLAANPIFAASGTDVLTVRANDVANRPQLVWVNRDGRDEASIEKPPDMEFINPAISPRSGRVAVNGIDPQTGNWDIWLLDRGRGTQTRLTLHPSRDTDAVWSRSDEAIVFGSQRNGRARLYRKAVDSSEPEAVLFEFGPDMRGIVPSDWSPDGQSILFSPYGDVGVATSIWLLTLGSPATIEPLLSSPGLVQYAARFSPDGKWIAYASSESGRFEVYVRPFKEPGPRIQVSRNGGTHPRWINDGREIAYWAHPGGIAVATVNLRKDTAQASAPLTVVPIPVHAAIDFRTHYDVTIDGQHFLVRRAPNAPEESMIVRLNWASPR